MGLEVVHIHTNLEIVGTRGQKAGEKQSARDPAPLSGLVPGSRPVRGYSRSLESLERPVGETGLPVFFCISLFLCLCGGIKLNSP